MLMYKTNSRRVFEVFLYAGFTLFCLTILLPFVNAFALSFSSKHAIMSYKVTIWPVGFNTDAYQRVLQSTDFFRTAANTVFITAVNTVQIMLISLLAAFSLSSKHFIGTRVGFVFLLVPMYFSGGLIPTYIAITRWYHLYDSRLALILPTAVNMFYVIVFRNIIKHRIPGDLLDAAEIDGAGNTTVLFRILVPLMFPVIMAFTIFTAVQYWNMWFEVLIYIRNDSKWTLQFMLKMMLSGVTMIAADSSIKVEDTEVIPENLQMASLLLTIAPIVAIYPFLQRFFIHGVLVGAVKG